MKSWYTELIIDEDLCDRLNRLIETTGEDDEDILLHALREYVYSRTK